MAKFIVLTNQQELEQKFLELVHLAIKTRKHEKKYREQFGYENKVNMQEWQARMDAFIEGLLIKEEHQSKQELQVHFTNHNENTQA